MGTTPRADYLSNTSIFLLHSTIVDNDNGNENRNINIKTRFKSCLLER